MVSCWMICYFLVLESSEAVDFLQAHVQEVSHLQDWQHWLVLHLQPVKQTCTLDHLAISGWLPF